MAKKEKRMSLKAKKLLANTKEKFSHNPRKAIKYLSSIKPKELNLYDRQKIGREIIARKESMGEDAYDQEDIERTIKKYSVFPSKESKRGKLHEEAKIKVPWESSYLREDVRGYSSKDLNKPNWRIKLKARGDRYFRKAEKLAKSRISDQLVSFNEPVDFNEDGDYYVMAGNTYKAAGALTKALQSYEKARGYDTDDFEKEIKEKQKLLRKMKRKRAQSSKLENQISGPAVIIGLLSGIFFLSPNLTGNTIANLTNQTSNIIGGGLFLIGIIGGFMWLKKR